MAELKAVPFVSDWVTAELETTRLSPPIIKLKLRRLGPRDLANYAAMKPGDMTMKMAMDAIVEWDVTDQGLPLAVTDSTLVQVIERQLGEEIVKGTDKPLAVHICNLAQSDDLFLKN